MEVIFLQEEDVLLFFREEMKRFHSKPTIRDRKALDSALNAPKASFHGDYLMNIFEMAATHARSISFNHPFLDGNKRVAAISAVAFLELNGFRFFENHDEELADKILALVEGSLSKPGLAKYFKENCRKS